MPGTTKRAPLNARRILEAAVALADTIGIDSFTIRKLATALDTAPMTIYHHVRSKEELIDGMVEIVFDEIGKPPEELDWKEAIRIRCHSAREVLGRHRWAAPLMESRTSPGPANLAHHDAVIACLRRGGLSLQLTAHAYAILDSFVYGFAFEEATLPGSDSAELTRIAQEMSLDLQLEHYPALAEFTAGHVLQPSYNFGDSFAFGLDLIIAGLDRASR